MAHLTYPFTITPNTLASASQVMGNFDAIKSILNGGIDGTNLADGAVTAGKLASKAVDTSALADGAVTSSKLADGAVTNAKLSSDAVTGLKLAANAVDTSHIADGAVTSSKLANGGVTEAKLGNNAVSTDKIQDGAVTNAKLASATSSKTANTLAMRDSNGRLRVDTPSHNDDAANKSYVDGAVSSTFDVTVQGTPDGLPLAEPGFAVFQRFPVTVPSGHQLVLKRVRFQENSTSHRVRVAGATGTWTSTTHTGDVSPGTVLAGSGTNNVTFAFGYSTPGASATVGRLLPSSTGATTASIVATLAIEPV